MKIYKLYLLFVPFLILVSQSVLADSCKELGKDFAGKWTYEDGDSEHTIEFVSDSNLVIKDEIQKEMWLCTYIPKFDLISFYLKNEFTKYDLEINKDRTLDNRSIRIGSNFKLYNLKPYVSDVKYTELEDTFKWEPLVGMDGHVFPSLIISTATWSDIAKESLVKDSKNNKFELLGDPLGLFIVAVNNLETDAKVKVEISIGDIANDSVFEGVLKQPNKIYIIKPRMDYNFQRLLELKQPRPLNVKFTLYINGEKVGEQFKTVTIRSINDVPIAALDKNNKITQDLSFVFAAYVNENNPKIDTILREAIDTGEINSFSGYQGDVQSVHQQVYSIWNALQRRGIKYSSITTPTAVSNKVFSQYVRFFDDSLNTSQANCIDGTVLFASILRRVGINPKIVLVPGHAFLGYDLDSSGTQTAYLETTMIGITDLGERRQGKSLDETLSKMLGVKSNKNSKSFRAFVDAINEGNKKALTARSMLQANNNPNYKIIDINKARIIGVTPINH